MRLCHVIDEAGWRAARAAKAVNGAPFLHCCTPDQLPFVLGRHFAGRDGLLVLRFEAAALTDAIRWVKSEPDQEPFPHLHAPLPIALVTQVDQVGE